MPTAKKTVAAKATKATATAVVDPFAGMLIATAPPTARTRKDPVAPPVTPAIQTLAAALKKDGAQFVSVVGWDEDKVKLFAKTLRLNRATLFPEMRVRITPQETSNGPALLISLGKLGTRKTAA